MLEWPMAETSEGVRFDSGKPWAGTVLAGHWPRLRERVWELVGLAKWELEVIDALFDTGITYQERLESAAKKLTSGHHKDWLQYVIEAGHYGAQNPNYGPDNWLRLKGGSRRCYEAAGRHIRDWICGTSFDVESTLHQRSHIWWNIMSGDRHVQMEKLTEQVEMSSIVSIRGY